MDKLFIQDLPPPHFPHFAQANRLAASSDHPVSPLSILTN